MLSAWPAGLHASWLQGSLSHPSVTVSSLPLGCVYLMSSHGSGVKTHTARQVSRPASDEGPLIQRLSFFFHQVLNQEQRAHSN